MSADQSESSACFWEGALYDYFSDLSNHSQTPCHSNTQPPPPAVDQHPIEHGKEVTLEELQQIEQEGYGAHAALHYQDVAEAGPPARPQEFPTPLVREGVRTSVQAMDHRTRKVREVKNVLMASHDDQKSYLMKKKISKSAYGNVYLSVVLRRRLPQSFDGYEKNVWDVEWESTNEFVAITISPWDVARRGQPRRSRSFADPVHAIAAMQHVGNYHPNVLGCLDVLHDDSYLYTVAKFHGGVDLQTKIIAGRHLGEYVPDESKARQIFSQLLKGLFHLQKKGVYHSNISLENIFVDENNKNLAITGLGRSVRVPYDDPCNLGCITGETEGTPRRLLQLLPQDFQACPAENLMYLAPEILENEDAFDGFAADLWAASVSLFILLVGMAPFKSAYHRDAAYAEISSGNLNRLLQSLNINLSGEATDLLQNMLWRDPHKRLTLAQIFDHPWVKGEYFPILHKSLSGSHLSSVETASTTSTCNSADKAKSSGGSKKSGIRRTISDLFGGGISTPSSNGSGGYNTGSLTKSVGKMISKKRSSSVGGLSSAASSFTAGSPASSRPATGDDNDDLDDFNVRFLQIPNL